MKKLAFPKSCKVIKAYMSVYPNPIKVKVGEILRIGKKESDWTGWIWCTNQEGKSGWLPDNYVKKSGSNCIVLCDYEATELTVEAGETLIVDKEESGWLWCKNKEGIKGWIPADLVCYP